MRISKARRLGYILCIPYQIMQLYEVIVTLYGTYVAIMHPSHGDPSIPVSFGLRETDLSSISKVEADNFWAFGSSVIVKAK